MLRLKLQFFGHLIRRAESFEKTLTLGKTEGKVVGEGGRQKMRRLGGSTEQWKGVLVGSGSW